MVNSGLGTNLRDLENRKRWDSYRDCIKLGLRSFYGWPIVINSLCLETVVDEKGERVYRVSNYIDITE